MRGRLLAASAGWCLFAAGAVLGQSTPESVAALEARAADERLSIAERNASADRAIVERRELIDRSGADDRAPTWMIDQAAAVLSRLSRDGADTAVLFGLPTPDARQRVRAEALAALSLVEEARGAIERIAPAAPPDRAEVLLDVELALRAPFYQARAAVLTAATEDDDDPGRRRAADLADTAVAALAGLVLEPGPAENARHANLGLALVRRARGGDEQRAFDEFTVAERGASDADDPYTRAEAVFGRAVASARGGDQAAAVEACATLLSVDVHRPPFRTGRGPDALLTVLAHECAARLLAEESLRRSSPELLAEACRSMGGLLDRGDLAQAGVGPEARLRLVVDRLGDLLADRRWAASRDRALRASAAASFAWGVRRGGQPGGESEGAGLLAAVADRPDAGPLRSEALWESAVIQTRAGAPRADRAAAVGLLVRLARDDPSHPRAGAALDSACDQGLALAFGGGADPARGGAEAAATIEALRLAVARAGEGAAAAAIADGRRVRLASLLLGVGGSAPTRAELDEALSMTEAVSTPAARRDAFAVFRLGVEAAIDSATAESRRARDRGDARAAAVILEASAAPLARRGLAWDPKDRAADPEWMDFRDRMARVLVDARQADGPAVFESFLADPATPPSRRAGLRLDLGLAQRAAGDPAAAFATLRDLAASLESARPIPEAFWVAWANLLELLAEQNGDGSRTAMIRAHAARLRTLDPALGSGPAAARIEALSR